MNSSEVTLPTDTSIEVSRRFDLPTRAVWRAFTESELFARWCLGPPGWSMPVCEMDVRPGGQYRWRWRHDDDGSEFGFFGEFREVVAEAKLVHTEIYDAGDFGGAMGEQPSLVTVEFLESDGFTFTTTTIDFATQADRDAAFVSGMCDGMEMSYQRLEELLGQ